MTPEGLRTKPLVSDALSVHWPTISPPSLMLAGP
jgi:hypothetical protein